jgi:hypothetical protein
VKRTQIHIDDPGYLAWKRRRDEQRLLSSFFPDNRVELEHAPPEPHPLTALMPYAPFLAGAAIVLAMLLIITLLGGW